MPINTISCQVRQDTLPLCSSSTSLIPVPALTGRSFHYANATSDGEGEDWCLLVVGEIGVGMTRLHLGSSGDNTERRNREDFYPHLLGKPDSATIRIVAFGIVASLEVLHDSRHHNPDTISSADIGRPTPVGNVGVQVP